MTLLNKKTKKVDETKEKKATKEELKNIKGGRRKRPGRKEKGKVKH